MPYTRELLVRKSVQLPFSTLGIYTNVTVKHKGGDGWKGRGVWWVRTTKGIENLFIVCLPIRKRVAFSVVIIELPDCIKHLGLWTSLTCLEPSFPPLQALVPHPPLSAPHPKSNSKARATVAFLGVSRKRGGMER